VDDDRGVLSQTQCPTDTEHSYGEALARIENMMRAMSKASHIRSSGSKTGC